MNVNVAGYVPRVGDVVRVSAHYQYEVARNEVGVVGTTSYGLFGFKLAIVNFGKLVGNAREWRIPFTYLAQVRDAGPLLSAQTSEAERGPVAESPSRNDQPRTDSGTDSRGAEAPKSAASAHGLETMAELREQRDEARRAAHDWEKRFGESSALLRDAAKENAVILVENARLRRELERVTRAERKGGR